MNSSGICRADFSVHSLILWDDLIGNKRVKRVIPAIMKYSGIPPKAFLAGPSGSGKSTLIDHLCATLMCYTPKGDDPCGTCEGCKKFKPGHRDSGVFASLTWDREVPVHYLALNCRNIAAATIDIEFAAIRMVEGIRIVHLEEASNLNRLKCDEMLTALMDDPDFATCRWFATGVRDHGLDFQFRRRWTMKLHTSPPTVQSAARLLAKRCQEQGIGVDHPATLELLAQRSWCVMGLALTALGTAIIDGKRLTRDLVLDYPFPKDGPWQQEFFQT